MTRREFMLSTMVGLQAGTSLLAQDASSLGARVGDLRTFNRTASRFTEGGRDGVRLSEATAVGIALLPDLVLANGTVELDLRGRNLPQRSFVGVAFHAVDAQTYDAVYFRPFNFQAGDPVSRSHAVQYHSLPGHDWPLLRAEQPGRYEQPVNPAPNPTDWFHARIVIAQPTVSVFVNDSAVPCLSVELLSGRRSGMVGLWVGNNSNGDFANLKVTPS